ncbi:MAG TPA: glutamine-hydrolyzing carbamoyl-phosphate synthase small subunit [Ignavibacteria bacterium]|nr:glutamine-hydrolyzing carbamoyl-phosphate synthase small subunit [Ignavibacteria bacterium]
MRKGKLVLENGKVFEGFIFGFDGTAKGEVVFNTSFSGYQEIITDPSYYGQIVMMTYPLIGNYGTNLKDSESIKAQVSGFITGNYEDDWSNFEGIESLNNFLKQNNVTAITGIDTRELTREVRSSGAMRGIISPDISSDEKLLNDVLNIPSMSGLDLVKNVTTAKNYIVSSDSPKYKIAVYDFGIKKNILREFLLFENELKVFNANTSPKEILDYNPDGIFLSNGPGDPAALDYAIENTRALIPTGIPLFGICLGHQLVSLALGGSTYKLKFGHRGGNHPVKNHLTNKIEITSQNHGFAVDESSLNKDVIKISHTNLYDGTNEGLVHNKYPVMSVQYHPEAAPGPNDSKYLFTEFMKLVDEYKK